jgi:ketosteroid isomerase-like protein
MTTSLDPSGDLAEIRQLVERYAGAVDRADHSAATELFTEDGEFDMWLDPTDPKPTATRRGHAEIAASLALLDQFVATQHVIANSVIDVRGDSADGWTQCMAHHLARTEQGFTDQVLFINYVERLARVEGMWRFSRRELRVRWTSVLPVESA